MLFFLFCVYKHEDLKDPERNTEDMTVSWLQLEQLMSSV